MQRQIAILTGDVRTLTWLDEGEMKKALLAVFATKDCQPRESE